MSTGPGLLPTPGVVFRHLNKKMNCCRCAPVTGAAMKGNKEVITRLNEALKLELGAINQYWLHYRLLDNWGFKKLAKKERKESIEEMEHADRLVDRIIFLDGHPNLQHVAPLMIGENL